MNRNRLERLDRLFNQVYKISELLNGISMELAKMISEISKEEIDRKNSTQLQK